MAAASSAGGRSGSRSRAARPLRADCGDPLFNQSVQKAFAILEAFTGERRAMSLADIAVAAGMTKSSAQRCIHTLCQLGYLQRGAGERGWALAPRCLNLAHSYLSGYSLIEQATTHLVDLNQACGESVSLAEPDGIEMVYVARFPSHKRFFIHMPIGRRLPMYCTASGRAYLSALPAAEAQRILRGTTLRAMTPMTLTDPRRIWERIEQAAAVGYAWTDQEMYRGDVTIAAAIIGTEGRPVGAVNLSAPTGRWTLDELRNKLSSILIETARAASSGISAHPRR